MGEGKGGANDLLGPPKIFPRVDLPTVLGKGKRHGQQIRYDMFLSKASQKFEVIICYVTSLSFTLGLAFFCLPHLEPFLDIHVDY